MPFLETARGQITLWRIEPRGVDLGVKPRPYLKTKRPGDVQNVTHAGYPTTSGCSLKTDRDVVSEKEICRGYLETQRPRRTGGGDI